MINLHEIVAKVKSIANQIGRVPTREDLLAGGITDHAIRSCGGSKKLIDLSGVKDLPPPIPEKQEPKILILDIETSPLELYGWQLFGEVNFGLNQVKKDWLVLSWAAKWLGSPESQVMYADLRDGAKDDSGILSQIWQLLDEADIVITQNGIRFDIKKLNARFIQLGYPKPSSFRQIDTLRIAKKHFSFTSNKLAYMTDKLCTKYKKLDHAEFSGFDLWKECLAGNLRAWDCMRTYNSYDILSLEELYLILRSWDSSLNFNVYHDNLQNKCVCGSVDFKSHGYRYSNSGKFSRHICSSCGAEYVDKFNLLDKEKKKALKELS